MINFAEDLSFRMVFPECRRLRLCIVQFHFSIIAFALKYAKIPPMPSVLTTRPADESIAAKLRGEGVAPLLARALSARKNVNCKADIAPALQNLPTHRDLPGMENLARILADAIENNQPVCVVGDYDADGVTAAALAFSALKKMGAQASWRIPERPDGYGLNPQISELAAQDARVLLTVDNGASAVEGVRRARELGMTVCVTDHHLPPESSADIPPAHCAVNPKSSSEPWAAPNLSGVGVAFYAMAALRAELTGRGKLHSPPNLADFLDLAAVGTIADCVPMDAVNRSLAAQGLARIRAGRCCAGLRAILDLAGRPRESFNSRGVSHALAPRVNAAGRLNDAKSAMRCLLAENDAEARLAAARLEELNNERVRLQRLASDEAVLRVSDPPPDGIVLHDSDWHPGVIGIVAARLGDVYGRPAIVFADDGGGGRLKGSGRTVNGFNLHAALSGMRLARPDLFEFGGHSSAVGVRASLSELGEFAGMFSRACGEFSWEDSEALEVDESPRAEEITLSAARQLDWVSWGMDFPVPRFAGEFGVVSERVMRGGHVRMILELEGRRFPAVRFFADPSGESRMTAVYGIEINHFGSGAQLVVERTL